MVKFKTVNLLVKYCVLLLIVILSQVCLLTYNHKDSFVNLEPDKTLTDMRKNLTEFPTNPLIERKNRHLLDDIGDLDRYQRIRDICDKQKIDRGSKNLDTLYLSTDKRFHQRVQLKNFLVDQNRGIMFYFNRGVDARYWSGIFPSVLNQTNNTSSLKIMSPRSENQFLEAKENFAKVLLGSTHLFNSIDRKTPTTLKNKLPLMTLNRLNQC